MARTIDRNEVLGLTIWSCLVATPLLFGAALLIEGPAIIADAFATVRPTAWLAVLWQSFGNTLFGYGLWAWLLARHPASAVTPLALLVPVFGMATAALVLGEALPAWKLTAAGLVLTGLVVNVASSHLAQARRRDNALGEPVRRENG